MTNTINCWYILLSSALGGMGGYAEAGELGASVPAAAVSFALLLLLLLLPAPVLLLALTFGLLGVFAIGTILLGPADTHEHHSQKHCQSTHVPSLGFVDYLLMVAFQSPRK